MKTIKWVLVTLFILSFGCSKNSDVIKIGASMPLTGDGAVYGVPQKNAAQMAVDEINKTGGLLGMKVILDAQDDQAKPTLAANNAQYFVTDKNLIGVIGFPNSGNAIAASKIFAEHNIPYVASSPTNPVLTQQGFKNVFRFAPTDNMQGASDAKFIKNVLRYNELFILHDNQAYGKGLATNVKESFEKLGGKVSSFDAIQARQNDYRTILYKIKNEKPKVIFYGGMLEEGAKLVQQAKEIGLNVKFVFGDGCFDQKFKQLAGTDCKNVYISFLAPPWDSFEPAKKFAEQYKGKYGESVPPFAPYGYDAVMVLSKAIEKANSNDKDKIIESLKTLKYKGITGNIWFNENGQTPERDFYFYHFNNNGQLVIKL